MTSYDKIILKYYPRETLRYRIYMPHCRAVTELALKIARLHPELGADLEKLELGGMLHDIGIYLTDSPDFGCFGELPYIMHGFKGRQLLEKEGLKETALVCERHIGVGITLKDIEERNLPLPKRDMTPQTIEEKLICYTDKFYSKSATNLMLPKPLDKVKRSISKHGQDKWKIFEGMIEMFGTDLVYD